MIGGVPHEDVAIATTALGSCDGGDHNRFGCDCDTGASVATEGKHPGFVRYNNGILKGLPEVAGGSKVDSVGRAEGDTHEACAGGDLRLPER